MSTTSQATGVPADPLPTPAEVLAQFSLDGTVAVVTGSASGLGRIIAWGLACYGADLVLADRNVAGMEELAGEIRALGRRSICVPVNVAQESDIVRLTSQAVAEFGRIDVAVNAAGNNCRKPVLEMSTEEFEAVIDVHLRGTFLCARHLGRVMVEQRRGKMINLASIIGHVAAPDLAPYAAAKGGIIQLTKVLALEWAPFGVQVNALAPAHFDTPMTRQHSPEKKALICASSPQRRFADPPEIIGAAVLLASKASGFITGTSLLVDGGWTAQ